MQKFKEKIKNAPRDTSPVSCSVTNRLNKDENLSVDRKALSLNSSEGNQAQHTERSIKTFMYVLNCEGMPLMPCSYAKSKRMVKAGKAKVVKRSPFTIQLNFKCENKVQECTLGVDSGYKNIGLSVVSKKKELFSANVQLRTDVSDKLSKRAMYRRSRRNRLWYRKPRWKNRANARKEGRLMPSVKQKIDSHIKIIKKVKSILPISKLVIETGLFDMAKMKNPNIKNWQYQKGDLYGFENVKAFVLSRDQHICYFKKGCSNKLHVHHIKFKSQGGNDKSDNLITVCEKHHAQIHKGKLKLEKVGKFKELKSATVMNIIRKRVLEYFSCAIETFGYETKVKIRKLGLEKSHINDAFVIANGDIQERCTSYNIIQKRKNNRCLQKNRKGFKPSIRRQRYKIQPKDLVEINKKIYTVMGVFNYGKWIRVKDIYKKILNFSIKKIEKHIYNNGWQFIPPPPS